MPSPKKKQQCYLYTRVSTQMQVDGYSLDAQRDRLIKEAKHREMAVAAEFSDEGKSGKNTTGRPQFTEMMNRIQNGNPDGVSYVLVFKLSRFGRNTADVLNNLQLMEDYGVNLLSVDDGIDSAGAAGKLMIAVLAAVAEIERENIQAQTMAGRIQKAREGAWNGGPAPYGYKIENGALAVEESEADLVRMIFDKFANTDLGYSGVAKWLNANGYTKNTRQTNLYSRISASFVKAVLDNPVYTGMIAYGRRKSEKIEGTRNEFHRVLWDGYDLFEGKHDALVTDETWQAVRRKRSEYADNHAPRYGPKNVHILSGLIRCPECGSPMFGRVYSKPRKGGGFYSPMRYYYCKNRFTTSGKKCSYVHQVRQEVLDAQVRQVIQEALRNRDFTDRIVASLGTTDNLDAMNAELDALQAARKKELRQKTKLLGKIAELDADDDLYDSMYEDLHSVLRQRAQSIADLDDKIEQVSMAIYNAGRENLTAEQVRKVTSAYLDMLDIVPAEEERLIVHALVDNIEIHPKALPSGLVLKKIRFKIPLDWDGYDSPIIGLDITDDDEDGGGEPPSGGTPPPDKDSPSGGSCLPDIDLTPDGDFSCAENSLPKENAVPSAYMTLNSAFWRVTLGLVAQTFRMSRMPSGALSKETVTTFCSPLSEI